MTSHPKDSIPGRYVAAIAAMALAAHGMMLGRGFVWDDRILRADWALRGHWGLFEPDVFGFVRPGKVFHFSFFETLFGGTAALWQLAALATVVVCGLLVLRLAMHFLPREGALAAALVYTVHPFHVESAGWPSAFNGTLMVLFALLFYLQLLRERFGWREVAVSCALVLSAVLMKEEAVVVPVAGAALVWMKGLSIRGPRLVSLAGALLLAGGVLLATRAAAATAGQQLDTLPYQPLAMTALSPGVVLGHFVYFALPFRWAFYTEPLHDRAVAVGLAAVAWLGALFFAWAVLRARFSVLRKQGRVEPWILLAALAMLPLANVLPLGNTLFGVRYLAHPGVFLAIAAGCAVVYMRRFSDSLHRSVVAVLGAWLLAMVAASAVFHWQWRSEESLFGKLADTTGEASWFEELARLALDDGDIQMAGEWARRAVEAEPQRTQANVILGLVFRREGRNDEARESFLEALQLDPDNVDALVFLGDFHDERYTHAGDPEDRDAAVDLYRRALSGRSANVETAFVNLGLIYAIGGDIEGAVDIWSQGLERFPGSEALRTNLEIARRGSAQLQD